MTLKLRHVPHYDSVLYYSCAQIEAPHKSIGLLSRIYGSPILTVIASAAAILSRGEAESDPGRSITSSRLIPVHGESPTPSYLPAEEA